MRYWLYNGKHGTQCFGFLTHTVLPTKGLRDCSDFDILWKEKMFFLGVMKE